MTLISLGGMYLPKGAYQPNWSVLIELLELNGFELSTELTGKFYLGLDHDEATYHRYIRQGGKPELAILVRQETDAVYPGQYKKRIEQKYGLVLTLGGVKELRQNSLLLGHPYMHSPNPTFQKSSDSKFLNVFEKNKSEGVYDLGYWLVRPIWLSLVGANKVGLSPKGNYAIRRKFVDDLASSGLEVYGPLWNDGIKRRFINRVSMVLWGLKSRQFPPLWSIFSDIFRDYKNAKGEVLDKHSILLKTKFSLIVENSDLIVTEKLFDAILSGSIPVYYGPDLSQFDLPTDIAIEIKKIHVPIHQYISSLTDEEIKRRLEISENFLGSSSFRDYWLAEPVFLKVYNTIKNYLDEH